MINLPFRVNNIIGNVYKWAVTGVYGPYWLLSDAGSKELTMHYWVELTVNYL
jgi:hypothetical protein